MKLNHKFVRTVTTTAAVLGAAAMLSVAHLPQRQTSTTLLPQAICPRRSRWCMGDIALHSADVAIGEKEPHLRRLRRTGGKPHSGQYHADLRR